MLGVNPLIAADNDIAVFIRDIESGLLAAQTISDQIHLGAFRMQREMIEVEKVGQDLLDI